MAVFTTRLILPATLGERRREDAVDDLGPVDDRWPVADLWPEAGRFLVALRLPGAARFDEDAAALPRTDFVLLDVRLESGRVEEGAAFFGRAALPGPLVFAAADL